MRHYTARCRGPRPPSVGRAPGTRLKLGDRIELDCGDIVTVAEIKLCGSLSRRDYLHIFDSGLSLTGREVEMNTRRKE